MVQAIRAGIRNSWVPVFGRVVQVSQKGLFRFLLGLYMENINERLLGGQSAGSRS